MNTIVTTHDKNNNLRKKSRLLSKEELNGEHIKKLKSKMKEALSKEKYGVAIAAPQIAENVACFLISAQTFAYAKKEDFDAKIHKDKYFFNPQIIKHSKKQILGDEGCLSVPFKYSHEVPRYEKITIKYLDCSGEEKTLNASGFLARVLQHEIDHLEGILYIDRAKKVIDVDENLKPVKKIKNIHA